MGKMYWVRVGFMIMTLIGVFWVRKQLMPGERSSSKAPSGTKLIVGTGDLEKIVLCPTRVKWLELTDGQRIEQKEMKWFRTAGETYEELHTIEVEKWFGRNCSVNMQRTESGQDFRPIMKVGFISGDDRILMKAGSGEYLWDGVRFVSAGLDQALQALDAIPTNSNSH